FVVLIAITSVAVWRASSRKSEEAIDYSKDNLLVSNAGRNQSVPQIKQTAVDALAPPKQKPRIVIYAARRQAAAIAENKKAARAAVAISNWQSPTTALLRSPSDEMFTSLPQLDENASELKSFLTRTPK